MVKSLSLTRDNFDLPFKCGYLLSLFLTLLLWLIVSMLCWIDVVVVSNNYFRENAFSLIPLSVMSAVGIAYMASIMWRKFPSIPTLLSVFVIKGCWIFQNVFFPINWGNHLDSFYPVKGIYFLDLVLFIELSLYSRNKTHLVIIIMYIFLNTVDISLLVFCCIFCVNVHKRYWSRVLGFFFASNVFVCFLYYGKSVLIEWVSICALFFNFFEKVWGLVLVLF